MAVSVGILVDRMIAAGQPSGKGIGVIRCIHNMNVNHP